MTDDVAIHPYQKAFFPRLIDGHVCKVCKQTILLIDDAAEVFDGPVSLFAKERDIRHKACLTPALLAMWQD